MKWFRAASEQGHSIAKAKLGLKREENQRMKANINGNAEKTFLQAAGRGLTEEVASLIKLGVNINAREASGRTALMLAVEENQLNVVKVLLNGKADIQAINKYGDNALFIAVNRGNSSALHLLLEAGAKLNSRDANGNTALLLATQKRNPKIVLALLGKGADVEIRNHNHMTAAKIAKDRGYKPILHALLAKGAILGKNGNKDSSPFASSSKNILANLSPDATFKDWSTLMTAA